ncbi:uncharacterized protein Bfra_004993 [Botrytis fragariae]|uniref:Uncharacterized protein n=1 Tax=Botrytis fragariae TaxID=1964551 RepID=A0A8H6ATY8_9HELO|nr:uncharacterized protein Bfra_004993 [Botrytis fragariae]KAF5873531.1 hypothetical protein Bfra_004993 [Botrytis fragariae]
MSEIILVHKVFTDKDAIGSACSLTSIANIQEVISKFKNGWKPKNVEKEVFEIMRTLEMFKTMDPKEDKASGTGWEKKYSTEVCKALTFIMNQGNSATTKSPYPPYSPPKQAGASGGSNDGNLKEGATNVTPPSTNDTANRGGTSKPKKPSAPLKRASEQPAAASTSRPALPERPREGRPGDNIKVTPRGSSTERPPVAQSSTPSSSTKNPPQTRGGPRNSANSASIPPKTENGGSRRASHRSHGSSSRAVRQVPTGGSKTDEEKKIMLDNLPRQKGKGIYGGKGGYVYVPVDSD